MIQIPPVAPGPFCPDLFAGNGDGRGITWGLCHIHPYGTGSDKNCFLARFDCDLSKDVRRSDFKRNNLRFEEETYFQRVMGLSAAWKEQILAEQQHVDAETIV